MTFATQRVQDKINVRTFLRFVTLDCARRRRSPSLSLDNNEQLSTISTWDIVTKYGFGLLDEQGARLIALSLETSLIGLLSNFTPDAHQLRDHMRQSGAVIVGAACDAFLKNRIHNWDRTQDVQVVLPDNEYDNFLTYLLLVLRGTLEHRISAVPDPDGPFVNAAPPYNHLPPGVIERCVIKTDKAIFDLWRSETFSPLTALPYGDTTAHLNFLSSYSVCLAYPRPYDDNVAIVNSRHPVTQASIQLYESLGYTFRADHKAYWGDVHRTVCLPHGHCPKAVRYFGDRNCLNLTFDRFFEDNDAPLDWDIKTASWVWGGDPCGNKQCCQRIGHSVVMAFLPYNFACI